MSNIESIGLAKQTKEDRLKMSKTELPEALKKQLSNSYFKDSDALKTRKKVEAVLSKDPQTIDDVIVAHWQETGEVIKKEPVRVAIRSLMDMGRIKKVQTKYYQLS